MEEIKNQKLGVNFKVISNKPIILKDGTKAYRTELEYLYPTGSYKIGLVSVSAFRDKKVVNVNIHTTAGLQSELAWIPESLTFE